MRGARVCIALATLDGGAFLAAQLESFRAQTRPPDQLVAWDDGSSDDTVAQLHAFAERAPFEVRVEGNVQRLGSTRNFENAVRACEGDWIFLADQDDVWHREKIERHLEERSRRPGLAACFSDGRVVDEKGRPLGYTLWDSLWFDAREQKRVRHGRAAEVFARHVVAAGTTLSFRADLRELLLPFPALRSCHDAWVAFLAAATGEVVALDEALVDYRLHDANQIGLRRQGLLAQLASARRQLSSDPESEVDDAFAYAVRFFDAARQRLAQHRDRHPISDGTRRMIDAKIEHAQCRSSLPAAWLQRLPAIAREAVKGNYGRYSYGLKSVAQDLWLR